MLASPHYPQYAHQQQHLVVPSSSPYGYPPGASQQHSPSSRPYSQPPQMLHPAMMYPPPPPHAYAPGPYGHPAQQYWAAARSMNGPVLGQPMMGPPAQQAGHYPPQQQQQQMQMAQGQHVSSGVWGLFKLAVTETGTGTETDLSLFGTN
jgi:hypothetical protein